MDLINIIIASFLLGGTKQLNIGTTIWQIGTLVWALILYFKYSPYKTALKKQVLTIVFISYCIVFLISSLIVNQDSIILAVRQLSKDIIPFVLFLVAAKVMQNHDHVKILNFLFLRLIIAQIVFNIVKLLIFTQTHEGLVGSLTGLHHGGPGTSFPLLGLIYIALNTKMSLKTKDVLMIAGLLFVGVMAGKRAVILIFPVLFFLLSIYVYRHHFAKKLIISLMAIPILFYLGLRITPSLNPEYRVWGSFDPEHAWNYTLRYSSGIESPGEEVVKGHGRIGALVLVYEQLKSSQRPEDIEKTLFGYGHEYFVGVRDVYMDSDYWWGIRGRGAITEVLVKYFSTGLVATILYLTYILIMLSYVKNTRLKHVIIFTVLVDFILYNGTILTFPALFVMLIFGIFYKDS